MKKSIIRLAGIMAAGLILLCGCGLFLPNRLKFGDFPQFKKFGENISEIRVNWDVNDSQPLVFTITDTGQINELVGLYKSTVFKKAKGPKSDGNNHSYLTFVGNDGSETDIFLHRIAYGNTNQCYSYPDSKIFDYVKQIGIDAGVIT